MLYAPLLQFSYSSSPTGYHSELLRGRTLPVSKRRSVSHLPCPHTSYMRLRSRRRKDLRFCPRFFLLRIKGGALTAPVASSALLTARRRLLAAARSLRRLCSWSPRVVPRVAPSFAAGQLSQVTSGRLVVPVPGRIDLHVLFSSGVDFWPQWLFRRPRCRQGHGCAEADHYSLRCGSGMCRKIPR